jgi:membrane-associated protease RseP (regulator of RpoE activity)
MRSMAHTKPVAFLGVALLALGLTAAAPKASRADDTPWLGVTLQSLSEGLRDGMGYDGEGVLVNRVMDGSPADRAGLRQGDVIVRFNGRSAESPEQLTRLVRDARVGQTVSMTIVRDGDRRSLTARLGRRPDDEGTPEDGTSRFDVRDKVPTPMDHQDMDDDHGDANDQGDKDQTKDYKEQTKDYDKIQDKDLKDLKDMKDLGDMKVFEGMPGMDGRAFMLGMGRGRLGVRTEDLSPDLAPYFDAPAGGGALVMEVLKDTPAERAGLKAGDVIVRVGDEKISSADDLIRAMRSAPAGRLNVTVMRHGSRRTFEPEIEAAPRWDGSRRGTMSFGPNGNGRVIIRDKNGTRVYRDQNGGSRDEEMQQLRDEVRRLRQELNQKNGKDKDDEDDDN